MLFRSVPRRPSRARHTLQKHRGVLAGPDLARICLGGLGECADGGSRSVRPAVAAAAGDGHSTPPCIRVVQRSQCGLIEAPATLSSATTHQQVPLYAASPLRKVKSPGSPECHIHMQRRRKIRYRVSKFHASNKRRASKDSKTVLPADGRERGVLKRKGGAWRVHF